MMSRFLLLTLLTGLLLIPNRPADAQAVQGIRNAAERARSSNNLKQIVLGLHSYNDANNSLPAVAGFFDKAGKPLLSWRVAILPLIDQGELFRKFKTDEPWDSETNKALIPLMPKVYAVPGTDASKGMCFYRGFAGKNGGWEDGKPNRNVSNIADGSSNTIAIIESTEGVEWTKPAELPFDRDLDPHKYFRFQDRNTCLVAMFDGSVKSVNKAISTETLRNAIDPADGNALGADW